MVLFLFLTDTPCVGLVLETSRYEIFRYNVITHVFFFLKLSGTLLLSSTVIQSLSKNFVSTCCENILIRHLKEMSLLYFSVPRGGFSQIEMNSLKYRTAKIRHVPLCIKRVKHHIQIKCRESVFKGILKALQAVSEALYPQMIQ